MALELIYFCFFYDENDDASLERRKMRRAVDAKLEISWAQNVAQFYLNLLRFEHIEQLLKMFLIFNKLLLSFAQI